MVTDGHTTHELSCKGGLDNAVLPAVIGGYDVVVGDVRHWDRLRRRATHPGRQWGDRRIWLVWRCPSAVGDLLRPTMPVLRAAGVDLRRPVCRRSGQRPAR